jgi:hypothetical protein
LKIVLDISYGYDILCIEREVDEMETIEFIHSALNYGLPDAGIENFTVLEQEDGSLLLQIDDETFIIRKVG